MITEQLAHTERVEVRFRDGAQYLCVRYVYHTSFHSTPGVWTMELEQAGGLLVQQTTLIRAAVDELERLNGTQLPRRIGGTRPAKGGQS